MRVLITGASGFVGSPLVSAALRQGHDVIAVVRSRDRAARLPGSAHLDVVEADLADPGATGRMAREASPDLAVHLAWSIGEDYSTSPDNLACAAGSLALLRALLDAGCSRIVFVGTHLELMPGEQNMTENFPVAPRDLYATSKDAIHRIARATVAGTTSSFVWARLFNLYGPAQAEWALASTIICHLLAERRCPMTHGEQVRGFMHVRDAAAALLATGASSVSGVVHIGSDEAVTVREFALRVAEKLGRDALLDFGALPVSSNDAARIVPSIARLRTEVGFHPEVGMDEGIEETIEWWRRT